MNTEQQQRIEQIRERWSDFGIVALAGSHDVLQIAYSDIDFLLFIFKRQEADSDKQRECHAEIADSFRYGWNVNNTHRQVAETIAAAIRAEKGK